MCTRYKAKKTPDWVSFWQVAPKKISTYLLLYAYVNITGFGYDFAFST